MTMQRSKKARPGEAVAAGAAGAAPDAGARGAPAPRETDPLRPDGAGAEGAGIVEDDPDLERVFAVLTAAHEVDFTLYRRTTIARRILRRMALAGVATLREYLGLLHERPAEVTALHHDILIKVTQFFRDPEVFAALQHLVFPKLLEGRRADAPIRIWVPGCSTGEEAYSLAIALLEAMAARRADASFQLFGTDVSDAALEAARDGAYVEDIALDVSPERLQRCFVRDGARYHIRESIRARCIFARHDVTRDPPFSRLDLISCRNALIYLDPALQRRVIPLFHRVLEPAGYLLLGASETVRDPPELFSPLDRKNRIYAKSAPTSAGPAGLAGLPRVPEPPGLEDARAGDAPTLQPPRATPAASARRDAGEGEIERELAATKDYLRSTLDEHDAVREELQSANEELLSSNEELQSINEALALAREDLQSTNEELTLVNQELGNRNAALNRVNDDLGTLLSSVDLPIVMLGKDLCVRRFTPRATRLFDLAPGDLGRPIAAITLRVDAPDLERLLAEAMDTASTREREVQDLDGRWCSLRIRPCRNGDDEVDGAVIVLVDIDPLRRGAPEAGEGGRFQAGSTGARPGKGRER